MRGTQDRRTLNSSLSPLFAPFALVSLPRRSLFDLVSLSMPALRFLRSPRSLRSRADVFLISFRSFWRVALFALVLLSSLLCRSHVGLFSLSFRSRLLSFALFALFASFDLVALFALFALVSLSPLSGESLLFLVSLSFPPRFDLFSLSWMPFGLSLVLLGCSCEFLLARSGASWVLQRRPQTTPRSSADVPRPP